jgi:SPP1 family predicted phage head-tail adaptor
VLRAGRLNRRVCIERRTRERDAAGQLRDDWIPIGRPVWASIAHKSGLETIKADAETSIVQASIQIRYRTDVTAGMRVVHGSLIYSISAVLPDEERREAIYLVCTLGGSNG